MTETTKTGLASVQVDATGATRAVSSPETAAATSSRPTLPDDVLIIVPVRNVVLFPGIVFPLAVGRARSVAAVQESVRLQRPLGIVLQSKPEIKEYPA